MLTPPVSAGPPMPPALNPPVENPLQIELRESHRDQRRSGSLISAFECPHSTARGSQGADHISYFPSFFSLAGMATENVRYRAV